MRAKSAIIASQRARRTARLAQIPFDFAQGKLSLRGERLFGMTIKLQDYQMQTALFIARRQD